MEETQELTSGGECRPATYISSGSGWAKPKRTVAIVGHWRDRPNPEADARLIAAAPDMYEACLFALERANDSDTRSVLRAALQKAQGE